MAGCLTQVLLTTLSAEARCARLEKFLYCFLLQPSTIFYFLLLSYSIIINNLKQSSQATVYEGGVRSPGFLHAPNLFGEGRSIDGLVHVSDFFPTIASIVAHTTNSTLSKLDQRLDGVDLLPALLDRQEHWESKEKIPYKKSLS